MIRLGAFELLDVLARGGMGEIWDAVHHPSGTPVAIKVLAAECATHPGFVASLRHEASAMARLAHPNIVRAFDLGEVDEAAAVASDHRLVAGSPWLAMESVKGGTLADHILRLPWADVQIVLLKLLSALAHAHARDILHRDLKPANILLAEGRRTWDLKLTDFGIAQPLHTDALVGPRMAGTPMFMAPEQGAGDWRRYRPATDLFSVGRIAIALLARVDGVATVPIGFDAWLRRMLAGIPQERFAMAADAAQELRRLGAASVPLHEDFHPGQEPPTVLDFKPTEPARLASRGTTTLGRFVPPAPPDWMDATQELPAPLANSGAGLLGFRHPRLIGRLDQRNALWAQLLRTRSRNRTHLVVLRGAEGVGKHALASWLAQRAHETGAGWPHVVAFDPLEPGLDALGRLVAREMKTQGLSHLEAVPRIEELTELYGIEDPYDVQALAELANPKPEDEPGFRFGTRAERLQVLARFLHWTASARPTVVVFQDAQWSHAALELLEAVFALDRLDPVPLLLVVTVQEQALATCFRERAALDAIVEAHGDRTLSIDLPRLPHGDQSDLIASLIGFDARAVGGIARETDGNPLLAIQRVTSLHEEGRLVPGPRGYMNQEPEATTRTVAAVWQHRLSTFLDERSANSRISVELLAVLGRTVVHEDWLRLCRRAGVNPSRHLVDGLVAAGLLHLADDTYRFTHHTLRDAVLSMAEQAGRLRGHHAACADLLLRHARGVDREGRIGDHLLRAGRPAIALPHLQKGAERAFTEGRVQRARELIDRWQDAFASLSLPPEDPRQGNALALQARLAMAAAEPEPAERAAMLLERKARTHGWTRHRASALLLLGWAAYSAGRSEDALARLRAALKRVPPDEPAMRAEILFNLARTSVHWGDMEATRTYTAEARKVYLALGDAAGEAYCLLLAAHAAWQSGRPEEALSIARTARELAADRGSLPEQAEALVMAGEIHRAYDRIPQALDAYRLARRMLQVTRGPGPTAIVELNLVQALAANGDHAEAREMGVAAIEQLRRTGREGLAATGHCVLLPSLVELGHESAFARHLKAATEILERVHFRTPDAIQALELAARRAHQEGWTVCAAKTTALALRMETW